MDATAAVGELKNLGFTRHEVMPHVSFARIGLAELMRAASDVGIPYPNAQEALRRLATSRWVEIARKRQGFC